MGFNINEIRGQLTHGGARPNLFEVQITNPVNAIADQKTSFMCQAASMPASTLGMIEVGYYGRKIKVAGDRTFAEWTVTIINDEDFLVRNAMENWMAAINSHVGNVSAFATGAPSSYKSQAKVTQFSKAGPVLRSYIFEGIFPTNIAEITTDWNTNDDIERFDVTFQYDLWRPQGGVLGAASNMG